MKNIFRPLVYLVILLSASVGQAEDDFRYWSQYSFKLLDTQKVDVSVFTEGRFYDDASEDGLHLVQPKVSYDFWPNLTLGTNYCYIGYKSGGEYRYQHRAELEINPHFKLGSRLKFYNRNRIEFRWIEGRGSHNTRSRHRLGLTWPIKEHRWVKDIYCNSEFFYNWAENDYDENRTIPIGLTLKVTDKVSLKTYYMVQSQSRNNDWHSNQILGTLLVVKF